MKRMWTLDLDHKLHCLNIFVRKVTSSMNSSIWV